MHWPPADVGRSPTKGASRTDRFAGISPRETGQDADHALIGRVQAMRFTQRNRSQSPPLSKRGKGAGLSVIPERRDDPHPCSPQQNFMQRNQGDPPTEKRPGTFPETGGDVGNFSP